MQSAVFIKSPNHQEIIMRMPVFWVAPILSIFLVANVHAAYQPIAESEINIPTTIPFGEQLEKHAKLLSRLSEAVAEIDKMKDEAKKKDSLKQYLAAEDEQNNVRKVLAPYSIAKAKSDALIEQGYRLNNIEPKVCKPSNECTAIDAQTAVFFFDKQRGLGENLKSKTQQSTKNDKTEVYVNGFNLSAFLKFLGGKPLDTGTFGILPAIRDALIPIDNTGEIATWIRDPGKRSVEIVQNVRDGLLNAAGIGGENNDINKAIKDPIKCTVGKLFGSCN